MQPLLNVSIGAPIRVASCPTHSGATSCPKDFTYDVRQVAGRTKTDSRMPMARIVGQVVIFEAERTDRRHLRDVFAGLRPVEMPGLPR